MNFIKNAFAQKKAKNYDKLYWAIDLHDTIIEGKYNKFNEGAAIFPYAKEVLDYLYSRPDMCLILWTSSHREALDKTLPALGIKFHYINENPECKNTDLCDFNSKFYFNILLDDKCGFDGTKDWLRIRKTLKSLKEWKFSGKYSIVHNAFILDFWYVIDAEDPDQIPLFYADNSREEAVEWIKSQGGIIV